MVHGLLAYLMLPVELNKLFQTRINPLLWVGLVSALGCLSGCAAPLAVISTTGTAAASTAGSAAVANPGTAASLASTAATGKSPLEHAASAATKKECSFFNVIDSKPICVEVIAPKIFDKSEPLKGPADVTPESSKQ
jgi:hypothetical protein